MTIAYLGVDISSTSQRSFTSSLTASTSSNIVIDDGQHDNNNRFVCGYTSGKIRMFNMISGVCIATFNEHVGTVYSICNLNISSGGGEFASVGEDGMIKVWRSNHSNCSSSNNSHNGTQQSIDLFKSCSNITDTIPSLSRSASSNADSTTAPPIIRKSIQTIVGHTGPILAMAYVSSQILLTGGVDCSARVWNIEKVVCLRIFIGHAAPVTTVAVVDHVTFLTGSKDKSIKVWDGLSASCIRTYTGHTSPVTCVRSAQPGTFISASEDRTIKLWVYTAVSSNMNSDNGGTLNDILGFDDTFACMDCGKRNDTTDDNGTMIV
jgi:WD40 repeat protein